MGIRFNFDPSVARVVAIAVLLTIKDVIVGLLVYTEAGATPAPAQLYTILLSAALTLVIFLLAFLQTGEIPTEE